jgi:hypothetical protein
MLPSTAEVALVWFQRIVAAYCLLFGVLYWVKLIGFYPGALWRFDLMPVYWQMTASSLAVLFPFAAAGLWMLASWGVVIWVICAIVETTMYLGFPDLFGHRLAVVVSHGLVALIYVALRIMIWLQKRNEERQPDASF